MRMGSMKPLFGLVVVPLTLLTRWAIVRLPRHRGAGGRSYCTDSRRPCPVDVCPFNILDASIAYRKLVVNNYFPLDRS